MCPGVFTISWIRAERCSADIEATLAVKASESLVGVMFVSITTLVCGPGAAIGKSTPEHGLQYLRGGGFFFGAAGGGGIADAEQPLDMALVGGLLLCGGLGDLDPSQQFNPRFASRRSGPGRVKIAQWY